MRIQKYLRMCGVASRRKAEELVIQGRIKINGKTVSDYIQVEDGDIVEVDGKRVKPREKVYYLLNKPAGYLTTKRDPQGRKTIFDLLNVEKDVFPVGRLDKDTEGLLLLTNDGEMAQYLLHPRFQVERVYIAEVRGSMCEGTAFKLEKGLKLPYGYISRMKVEIVKSSPEKSTVRVRIKEGKKREIRRAFKFVGHEVLRLKRISFGPVTLERSLKSGEYRPLSDEELEKLKRIVKKNETLSKGSHLENVEGG